MPKPRRVEDAADAQGALAIAMATVIGNRIFAGQQPGVIGSCLAELMSTFLLNHQIPDDPVKEARLRETLLTDWCDVVRELVGVQDKTWIIQ